MLVISHDRDLLNQSVDQIMHLDQAKLTLYRGGYDQFERQRIEQQALQLKMKKKQDDERKHLQAFVDRFKAKASKAKQAQSRVKRLEKMQLIATIIDTEVLPFDFPSPERPLSPPIIAMEGASVGYGEKPVLSRLSLVIAEDDRIGLLGSNGNGKSTFAKLVAGKLATMTGAMRRSQKLKVAYFAQHQLDELRLNETPYQHVAELMVDSTEAKIRARCARMGFPGAKADTPVANISGGEKARLLMGLATFGGPHLLILDEPTNHLDIDSRVALMEAINDFTGAVILISHDRFLLEACADRLWLVGNGTVKPFDDDLDAYRRLVLEGPEAFEKKKNAAERREVDRQAAERQASDRRDSGEKRLPKAALKRELEGLEDRMSKLSELIQRVDGVLAKPDVFQRDPAKAKLLSAQRAELERGLIAAEEKWLALSSASETASG